MPADPTNDNPNREHRKRLRARFAADDGAAMPDYELLELLLFNAIPRQDTKPLARALLKEFGSLSAVLAAPRDRLEEVKGTGPAVVHLLKTVRAAGVRMTREDIRPGTVLSSWDRVVDYCRARIGHADTEHFHVLYLDRKNAVLADEEQSRGTVDHTPVYPREVVKRALELGASALILVHNHPSGDPTPSRADVEITKSVARAAAALDILVHDHIVIARTGHVSLKAAGLL